MKMKIEQKILDSLNCFVLLRIFLYGYPKRYNYVRLKDICKDNYEKLTKKLKLNDLNLLPENLITYKEQIKQFYQNENDIGIEIAFLELEIVLFVLNNNENKNKIIDYNKKLIQLQKNKYETDKEWYEQKTKKDTIRLYK
jgi:hypothetical protein